MLTNAPWLQINPLSFVDSAAKGAGLGLQASQIATGANEAADRLRLSYTQLAAEQAMHAASTGAARERASAEFALALHRDKEEEANRLASREIAQGHLGVSQQHQTMLEQNAADRLREANALKPFHVGNSLQGYDPKTGQVKTLLAGPETLDPYTSLEFRSAIKRRDGAAAALRRPGLDEDSKKMFQTELDAANADIQTIKSTRKGTGKSLSLAPTPEAPLGWQPTTGGDWQRPILPPMYDGSDELNSNEEDQSLLQSPTPAGGTNTFSVGKYKVTPLK